MISFYVDLNDITYINGYSEEWREVLPYEEFYKWTDEMSIHNTVLISEYNMPSVYKCIWSKETKANFDSNRTSGDKSNKRVEKLFTYNA